MADEKSLEIFFEYFYQEKKLEKKKRGAISQTSQLLVIYWILLHNMQVHKLKKKKNTNEANQKLKSPTKSQTPKVHNNPLLKQLKCTKKKKKKNFFTTYRLLPPIRHSATHPTHTLLAVCTRIFSYEKCRVAPLTQCPALPHFSAPHTRAASGDT
jgi:hypothetical protein